MRVQLHRVGMSEKDISGEKAPFTAGKKRCQPTSEVTCLDIGCGPLKYRREGTRGHSARKDTTASA